MSNEQRIDNNLEEMRQCNVLTCLHCVLSSCTLEECDMYEKHLPQEN